METSTPLTWTDEDRFVLGDASFETIPRGGFSARRRSGRSELADFFVAKPRRLVERYVRLVEELRPQRIFELGIFQGGSTALLVELARPQKLVGIDRRPRRHRKVEDFATRRGLSDAVRLYGEVDQTDRARLTEIIDEAFGDDPLDLVIDDCSHLYEATRSSFNVLFPLLRPGGVYLIEDWRWAHAPLRPEAGDRLYPGQVPLTRLVFDVLLALASQPQLIADVAVERYFAIVTRGNKPIDPRSFDITACADARGRALLVSL